jgi:hypothetical protein
MSTDFCSPSCRAGSELFSHYCFHRFCRRAKKEGKLAFKVVAAEGEEGTALGFKKFVDQWNDLAGCFPAGTPVHTADGAKAIEQIAVGDQVWSYDHGRLLWAKRRVVEVFRLHNRGAMATVRVNGETIRATGGDPFWVVQGEGLAERQLPARISAYQVGGQQPGRWVWASDLRAGDKILRRDGEVSSLDSVEIDETDETIYNFRVFELENYAVGTCGVLVHNTSAAGPLAPKRKVALGLGDRLDDFAGANSAETWKQFAKADPMQWKSHFLDLMNNPTAEVLFNLDGVDVWAGVTRASRGPGGATDWELLQILRNKDWWSRIKWFKNGVQVPNPFQ